MLKCHLRYVTEQITPTFVLNKSNVTLRSYSAIIYSGT